MLESPGMLLRASGGLGLAPDEPKSKLLLRGLYRDDIGVLVEELEDFICVIVKIMVPCWVLCFNTAPSIQGTQKGTFPGVFWTNENARKWPSRRLAAAWRVPSGTEQSFVSRMPGLGSWCSGPLTKVDCLARGAWCISSSAWQEFRRV